MYRGRLSILERLADLRRRQAICRVGRAASDFAVAERAARDARASASAAEAIRVRLAETCPERAGRGVTVAHTAYERARASWDRAADAERLVARSSALQARLERARAAFGEAERDRDAQRSFADRAARRARNEVRRRTERVEAEVALDSWAAMRADDAN